jgi:hypothetical protein
VARAWGQRTFFVLAEVLVTLGKPAFEPVTSTVIRLPR